MAQHMLDVQIAGRAPDERPSLEQERAIRQRIAAEFVPACVGAVTRETRECWMRAATEAEFEMCAGPPEPSSPEGAGPDLDPPPGDAGPDVEAR
jgi:hypothetical protein